MFRIKKLKEQIHTPFNGNIRQVEDTAVCTKEAEPLAKESIRSALRTHQAHQAMQAIHQGSLKAVVSHRLTVAEADKGNHQLAIDSKEEASLVKLAKVTEVLELASVTVAIGLALASG